MFEVGNLVRVKSLEDLKTIPYYPTSMYQYAGTIGRIKKKSELGIYVLDNISSYYFFDNELEPLTSNNFIPLNKFIIC